MSQASATQSEEELELRSADGTPLWVRLVGPKDPGTVKAQLAA